MSTKVAIKLSEQRKLHAKSGNRCAMCKVVLVDEKNPTAACIGENAHIYGEKPDAARYDSSQPEEVVNGEGNLIFLCCNCHKKIDTDVGSYPVIELLKLKKEHENWVVQQLEIGSASYTFAELEVLAKYLISNNVGGHSPNYSILKIDEKMKKNSLESVQCFITMGLSRVESIEEYINRFPDPNFSNSLTEFITTKYKELKADNLDSVTIFNELWDIASGRRSDFNYKAAGLGILVYFFEKCEVFEK